MTKQFKHTAPVMTGRLRSKLTSTMVLASMASVAMLGLVMAGGAPANAWGPQRETFTMQNPPDFITFDSITDNPDVGMQTSNIGERILQMAGRTPFLICKRGIPMMSAYTYTIMA